MSQQPDQNPKGFLDRVVFFVADTLDALGLNGTRLRWKWNQKRIQLGESGMRVENLWRSARSKHKMCPSCRALVSRGAQTCEECGTPLASVRVPGIGRVISNVLPGATAATSLILLANGFWFLMTMMAQIKGAPEGFGIFSGFHPKLLYDFGGGHSVAFLGGEWWRVVTPIFLHGGIIHFFFNSYVLLQLGPLVEDEFGTARFWVMYLLCGITGSVASQLWSATNPRPPVSIGASGAIMGLMGLLLVYGWRTGGSRGEALKSAMMRYAIYIVALSLLVRGIDHVNHAGGFACGALLALVVPSGTYRNRTEARAWEIAALAGVLLVVYAFYKVAASAMA